MTRLLDRVAGAPITWGVSEVPGWGHQLPSGRVLAEMSGLGLRATELGPEGYLPTDPGRLRDLLAMYGLALVGGFLPVVLHAREGLEERLASVSPYARLLAGAGAEVLVLAASATGPGYDRSTDLDREGWTTLVRGIDGVVRIAAEHGLRAVLHPHYGTAIERPAEVARLLESSSVSICLDTGHLMVGGTDPLELARSASGRVEHVHLKDVAAGLAERVLGGAVSYTDAVRGGMYRPLGTGDVDVAAIVRTLDDSGYEGWFVLEQDAVLESDPGEGNGPVRDASASLGFLRRVASELEDNDGPAAVAGGTRAARGATSRGKEETRW